MKKLTIIATITVAAFALTACTQNQRARQFGGTARIDLPPRKKLVNATFKQDDLWILTRDAKQGEKPERYEFVENSSWGILEGTVIITEK